MNLRRVVALLAVIGLITLGGFASAASAGSCCAGKGDMAGGSACPHMSKADPGKTDAGNAEAGKAEGGSCPMHKAGGSMAGKAGCAGHMGAGCCGYMGAGACGSMSGGQCGMPAEQCEKMMRSYYKDHGWVGIEMACAKPGDAEPTVTKVFPGSPADAAGFKVGDVLVSVNGIAYGPESKDALQKLMTDGMKVGDAETFQVDRKEQKIEAQLKVTLAPIPEAALAEMVADHKALSHKTDKAESAPATKD